MIAALSKTVQAIGEDAAHDVTVRILEIKAVQTLSPSIGAASVEEAWYRLLDSIGVENPNHFISKITCQIRAKRDRKEVEQRISSRRNAINLSPPKRRHVKGGPNPGWDEPPAPTSGRPPGEHNFVFDKAERREDFRTLNEEIGRLPLESQSLIRQVYWEDRAQSEIARERGESPSAVRSRLDRIRDRLRDTLVRRWKGQP